MNYKDSIKLTDLYGINEILLLEVPVDRISHWGRKLARISCKVLKLVQINSIITTIRTKVVQSGIYIALG